MALSNTFGEIDHEIIFRTILLPFTDLKRVFVSYKHKYVHKVLVNCLVKLAQETSVVRLSDRPDMTIAVDWDIKNQMCLTADPVIGSSILARSHTFAEIDREIISTAILLPFADSRRVTSQSTCMCTKYWFNKTVFPLIAEIDVLNYKNTHFVNR